MNDSQKAILRLFCAIHGTYNRFLSYVFKNIDAWDAPRGATCAAPAACIHTNQSQWRQCPLLSACSENPFSLVHCSTPSASAATAWHSAVFLLSGTFHDTKTFKAAAGSMFVCDCLYFCVKIAGHVHPCGKRTGRRIKIINAALLAEIDSPGIESAR